VKWITLGEHAVINLDHGFGKWTFLPAAFFYFTLGT